MTLLLAGVASVADAQPSDPVDADAGVPAGREPPPETAPALNEAAPVEPPPDEAVVDFPAEELTSPVEAPVHTLRPGMLPDPDLPTAEANESELAPDEPPRFHRYPREVVARPVTLPQGVMRFDSNIALSILGPRAYFSAIFGVAAGLHDDFEIGGIPAGWVFPTNFPDPYFYVRGRFLSGEVQLSGRLEVVVPVHALETQLGGALELAWSPSELFRLHIDLDYQGLLSNPYYQRIGIPVRGILQLGPNAIDLTSGIFVFNDFDDVDVPLLLGWTVALRGLHQGPLADVRIYGGFTDLITAGESWTIGGRISLYLYL